MSNVNMIEGIIIASFDEDDRLRQTLASTGRPYVILNRFLSGDYNCVAIDTRVAAYKGVRHLIDLGHRRIGHLAGRLGRFNGEMRLQGWSDALREAGLVPHDDLVAEAGYDPEKVPDAVDLLLAAGVTAIHAATLLTGAAAIARLHALGRKVPQEISVVTMHDDLLARVVYPEVTTVGLPTQRMGRAAAERLVRLIEQGNDGPTVVQENILLPPDDLIIRDSATVLNS
ncbi:LacI family DNA-binding transcriptional regulator [Roseovarius sp. D0-M9]|uniref:LacI family DNA-binding transcriptional regulator n=1 Tax=Roseovarius sp. D0-M9 TaxID=3127117 RepID=UPI003010288E